MRFHDFHLGGYEVRRFGAEIVLHLELHGEESHVRFADVELYHFVHTGGTIIFDIDEVPIAKILDEFWDRILHWAANETGGLQHWDHDDRATYQAKLEKESYRGWDITSSIGFAGFVISKSIEDVTEIYCQPPNRARWSQPLPNEKLRFDD